MKYIVSVYRGRQSGTIRLLTFFFLGFRWSDTKKGSYFRIFFQIHRYQIGLQFVTMN